MVGGMKGPVMEETVDQCRVAVGTLHLAAGGTATTLFEVSDRNHFDVIVDLARPATTLGDAVGAPVESTGAAHA